MSEHTPGPWKLGEYSDTLGYDCMTGGVRCGPAILDGADYGQARCKDITPEALAMMMADARLIAAAPDLLEALRGLADAADGRVGGAWIQCARAAIAKATGAA